MAVIAVFILAAHATTLAFSRATLRFDTQTPIKIDIIATQIIISVTVWQHLAWRFYRYFSIAKPPYGAFLLPYGGFAMEKLW